MSFCCLNGIIFKGSESLFTLNNSPEKKKIFIDLKLMYTIFDCCCLENYNKNNFSND